MARSARSLWYNLGAMFGNIAAGVKADPAKPPARLSDAPPAPQGRGVPAAATVVNTRVQEVTIQTPTGPVTLRRTVTDEVAPGPGTAPPSGA